jgi:hypothetical protein
LYNSPNRDATPTRNILSTFTHDRIGLHDRTADLLLIRLEMSFNRGANTQLLNFSFTHISTALTRLILWLNLPLCWFLTAATLTGHTKQWMENAVAPNGDRL